MPPWSPTNPIWLNRTTCKAPDTFLVIRFARLLSIWRARHPGRRHRRRSPTCRSGTRSSSSTCTRRSTSAISRPDYHRGGIRLSSTCSCRSRSTWCGERMETIRARGRSLSSWIRTAPRTRRGSCRSRSASRLRCQSTTLESNYDVSRKPCQAPATSNALSLHQVLTGNESDVPAKKSSSTI
jgi:hypothetical protein